MSEGRRKFAGSNCGDGEQVLGLETLLPSLCTAPPPTVNKIDGWVIKDHPDDDKNKKKEAKAGDVEHKDSNTQQRQAQMRLSSLTDLGQ
eukprot:885510-Rhodomonas_salina.2